jgi:hypothetical protein
MPYILELNRFFLRKEDMVFLCSPVYIRLEFHTLTLRIAEQNNLSDYLLRNRYYTPYAGNTSEVALILHYMTLNPIGINVNGFLMNYSFVTAVSMSFL